MIYGHNYPPSPEFQELSPRDQLFVAVSERYEEALDAEREHPGVIFVTDFYEDISGKPLAEFRLVESIEAYNLKQGMVLTLRVPVEDHAQEISGVSLLTKPSDKRFFIVKQQLLGHKQTRTHKVTDTTIEPYGAMSKYQLALARKGKIPKSFEETLLQQVLQPDRLVHPNGFRLINAFVDLDSITPPPASPLEDQPES